MPAVAPPRRCSRFLAWRCPRSWSSSKRPPSSRRMEVHAAIQVYDLVLFVHVTAAVVALGATFAYPFFQTVVERVSPRSVPAMFRAMHTSSRYLVTPGLFVVLAAGL